MDQLNTVWDGDHLRDEGALCGRVWGTYLHGWFAAPEVRRRVASAAGLTNYRPNPVPWAEHRQRVYAQTADPLVACVNLDSVRRYLGI